MHFFGQSLEVLDRYERHRLWANNLVCCHCRVRGLYRLRSDYPDPRDEGHEVGLVRQHTRKHPRLMSAPWINWFAFQSPYAENLFPG